MASRAGTSSVSPQGAGAGGKRSWTRSTSCPWGSGQRSGKSRSRAGGSRSRAGDSHSAAKPAGISLQTGKSSRDGELCRELCPSQACCPESNHIAAEARGSQGHFHLFSHQEMLPVQPATEPEE